MTTAMVLLYIYQFYYYEYIDYNYIVHHAVLLGAAVPSGAVYCQYSAPFSSTRLSSAAGAASREEPTTRTATHPSLWSGRAQGRTRPIRSFPFDGRVCGRGMTGMHYGCTAHECGRGMARMRPGTAGVWPGMGGLTKPGRVHRLAAQRVAVSRSVDAFVDASAAPERARRLLIWEREACPTFKKQKQVALARTEVFTCAAAWSS